MILTTIFIFSTTSQSGAHLILCSTTGECASTPTTGKTSDVSPTNVTTILTPANTGSLKILSPNTMMVAPININAENVTDGKNTSITLWITGPNPVPVDRTVQRVRHVPTTTVRVKEGSWTRIFSKNCLSLPQETGSSRILIRISKIWFQNRNNWKKV